MLTPIKIVNCNIILFQEQKNTDGSYTSFNDNTVPSEMKVLLNPDPNFVASSIRFVPLSYKRIGYRTYKLKMMY